MKRREFLAALGAAPLAVFPVYAAEQHIQHRIAFLGRIMANHPITDGLRQGLSEFGYVQNKNIVFDQRYSLSYEDLRPLADELVRMNPDVIVTFGTPAARAAMNATRTIPVVFTGVGDPVATGLAANLAKPGANGTGVSIVSTELGTKRLDLLRQLAPRIRRVGYLVSLPNPVAEFQLDSARVAAQSLGINLESYNVRNVGEVEPMLRAIPWKATEGMVISGDPIFIAKGSKIADTVRVAKIPAVFAWREFHEFGVVMSYGPNLREVLRRSAYYVDKILKGTKVSDLPVEQFSKIDLIIDLRAARSIGIRVPEALLYRADEVIR